jgi:hypothetical protein
MAKKSRRVRKKTRATRPISPIGRTLPAQPSPRTAKEPSRTETMAKRTVDLATEYRYVYADLKRIAITAAAMLAVLIILSFVIR